MLRKSFNKLKKSDKSRIRWRSHEPARIEALSDAVFGFAVSLLAFSLEVPKSSEELLKGLVGFIPFIICFSAIFFIWYGQYKFFRHYGLHDNVTIILNGVLLVLVLFYVYPLKFMFNAWLLPAGYHVDVKDVLPLIYVYIGGFMAIYTLFTLMYYNAFMKREELNLTPVEVFETQSYIYDCIALVCIGAIVILVAVIANSIDVRMTFICFAFFSLTGPVMAVLGKKREKLFRKKFGDIPAEEPELGAE